MVISCNSAKWYFCGQWSGYSGYGYPNHSHSLYPPPPPPTRKLLCAGVSLPREVTNSRLINDGRCTSFGAFCAQPNSKGSGFSRQTKSFGLVWRSRIVSAVFVFHGFSSSRWLMKSAVICSTLQLEKVVCQCQYRLWLLCVFTQQAHFNSSLETC